MALFAVVEIASIGPDCPEATTIACAAALGPAHDISAMHTYVVHATGPFVSAAVACVDNSCKSTHVPRADVR